MIVKLIKIFCLISFASLAQARETTFSWEPFEDVYAYEIRIAKEIEFKETLIRKGVTKPTFTVDLPIGKYFYKVRALDQAKRPGQWSDAVPFVVPPYAPEPIGPENLAKYSFYEVPPPITIEWKPVDGDPDYEVFITKTSGEKALEKRVRGLKFTATELTEGEYQWKLRSIYHETYESIYSEPRYFVITRLEFKAPELIDPIKNKSIPAYRAVDFTWKRDPVMSLSDVVIVKLDDSQLQEFDKDQEKRRKEELELKEKQLLEQQQLEAQQIAEAQKRAESEDLGEEPELEDSHALKPTESPTPTPAPPTKPIEKIAAHPIPKGLANWGQKNIESQETYRLTYMEPGNYIWTATNKEASHTPGLAPPPEKFEVRNDFVSAGNMVISMGLAPSQYKVTASGTEFARSSLASYVTVRYYPWEVIGFSFDLQSMPLDLAPYQIPYQRSAANVLLRGGVPGFAQDWFFGVRQMDLLVSDPVNNHSYYATAGFQTGLYMNGTIVRNWRFHLSALYYKPVYATSGMGSLTVDHYETELGVGKNIYDQFWLTYKFRNEKTVTNISDGSTRIDSEAFRVEPIHIMLSWEY